VRQPSTPDSSTPPQFLQLPAIAALTGGCTRSTYDGQAAMLLEQMASANGSPAPSEGTAPSRNAEGLLELDTRPLVAGAVRDLASGMGPTDTASRFHAAFAAAIAAVAGQACSDQGLDRVVLGGGVFGNRLLVEEVTSRLVLLGIRVFAPIEVPVGDGGIALGQALVAAAQMEAV